MYTNFFSLSELPFSIAPDPKYLFMSDRHREALTHLNYGLNGSGGFVLLTGEVGTGKTTVSRCLMTDLPENTQSAFILNPTLSSQELLATICDQLKIRYRKTGATLKTLTDKISEKLLKNHANDLNTLLIIDEAQHLEPQVLEQLRLLTNLETDTKKLLQVILIGQPELQQLLKRRDLRQLAQRITARYHLLPLNQQELAAYIKHRLSVADCHRALFNKGAISTIHRLSQGIPRLINLLCHSALMEAYNSNNAVVDKRIVLKAASHALGDDFEQVIWWKNRSIQIAMASSVILAVLVIGIWLGKNEPMRTSNSQLSNEQSEISKPEEQHTVQQQVASETPPIESEGKTLVQPIETKPIDTKSVEVKPVETPQIVVSGERQGKAQVTNNKKPVLEERIEQEPKQEDYQVESVDGVSEDLLARFQAAIDDTEGLSTNDLEKNNTQAVNSDVKSLTQMPTWVQEGVPSLRFEQHIYASDGEGWVNVNGRDRYEGDTIVNGVIIDKILPQQVILTYRGEKFSLPALTNW
jgi:type II secretory pathway predicted ATPase ExeA